MSSRLIPHPKNSSSVTIYQLVYYLLINSIVLINPGLSSMASVSYTYTMEIIASILFNL